MGTDSSLASHGVTTATFVSETNHTVASVFTAFLDTYSAQPYGNSYYLTGFPIYGTVLDHGESRWTCQTSTGRKPSSAEC